MGSSPSAFRMVSSISLTDNRSCTTSALPMLAARWSAVFPPCDSIKLTLMFLCCSTVSIVEAEQSSDRQLLGRNHFNWEHIPNTHILRIVPPDGVDW